MSNISAKEWLAFVKKSAQINETAAKEMNDYARIVWNDPNRTRLILNFAYDAIQKYGNASATLSALLYDSIASIEGLALPAAELASPPTYPMVAEAINGTMKHAQQTEAVANTVSRLVKYTGQTTLIQNAARDGAEAAWIPSGRETCPFCIILASRGWEYVKEGASVEHLHSNCDCSYMIRHRSDINVAGYDPDKYLSMYNNAEGNTSAEKIKSMRRALQEQNN